MNGDLDRAEWLRKLFVGFRVCRGTCVCFLSVRGPAFLRGCPAQFPGWLRKCTVGGTEFRAELQNLEPVVGIESDGK